MMWKWLLPLLLSATAWAIERQFTVHPTQTMVDQEFENIEKTAQSRTTMSTRVPVGTDRASEGSFWYNTSTNKLYIREKTGWQVLN